jgi:osmotically inducible protein OsmC
MAEPAVPPQPGAAAHAGGYSIHRSALLTKAGLTPTRIATTATVRLGEGPTIDLIELATEASVPGLTGAAFQQHAQEAKEGCPVSKALAGPRITLRATLV